jgi:predicted phosphate transport protein (TIGR00153 family)
MKFSFFPNNPLFYDLLEKLILKANEAGERFHSLIESWPESRSGLQELKDIEHACDQIVHEIMVKLNKTFITPIDRDDIHLLAKNIDDLVDIIDALGKRMDLFQIEAITPLFKAMTLILEKAIPLVVIIVQKIRNLKHSPDIFETCIQIHTLENQADRLFEEALGDLFKDKKDPCEIIKWKELYDFLESAIDKCEDIADIIWGIVVKYG